MIHDATRSVWAWRLETPADRQRTGHGWLRRRAAIQAVVMAVAGICVDRFLGHGVTAGAIWFLAAVVLVLGLAWPPGYLPVHRFGARLGRWVGVLLSYVMLVPLFYLVFLPVSLWLRLRGRDPLHRRPRDPRHTCWIRRTPGPRSPDYRRQFLLEDRRARAELRPVEAPADEGGAAS